MARRLNKYSENHRFSLRNQVSHWETWFLSEKLGFSLAVCTSNWKPVISLKITSFPRTISSKWRNAQLLWKLVISSEKLGFSLAKCTSIQRTMGSQWETRFLAPWLHHFSFRETRFPLDNIFESLSFDWSFLNTEEPLVYNRQPSFLGSPIE